MKHQTNHLIIGGGIAGLYLAYRLAKQNSKQSITVLEKNNRWGGRIYTVKKHRVSMEAGAGRFSENHKRLLSLINELGFKDNMIPIESKMAVIQDGVIHTNIRSKRFSSIQAIWEHCFAFAKKLKKSQLENIHLISFLYMVLTKEEVQILVSSFGYMAEMFESNAYSALQSIEEDFFSSFFVLKGGLSQLIDELVSRLKRLGVHMMLDVQATDGSKSTEVLTDKGIWKAKHIYWCLPKQALTQAIPSLGAPMRSVQSHRLVRIYAQYPTSWFADLPKCVIDNPIQMMIPINSQIGLIMISYSDSYHADFWSALKTKDIQKWLSYYLKQAFPDRTIPDPLWIERYDWDEGCATWNVGGDRKQLVAESSPYKLVGEFVSNHPGWVEGALQTVDDLF